MAVTNGWGQGVINNTNGFGKLATNNIGAGSTYENSHSGDTALIGTSAAFSYSDSSFTQADSNPTPTITGTTGGVFSGTSGLVFVSTSTGEIDLSASTIAAHVVTYTVGGVSSTFNLSVVSGGFSSTSSFSFDGVNDYFQIGENTDVITDFKQPWSVSWWAKWGTQVSTNFGNGFWQLGNIASGNIVQLCAQIDGSGTGGQIAVSFQHNTMTPQIRRGFGSGLNDNNWHHYCVTSNGSATPSTGNFDVYIDGSIQTQTGSSTASAFSTDSNNNIGRMKFGSSVRPFTGLMDEMSIWNTELSSDAVTEIASGTSDLTSLTNASSSNLKAWYKMGE